MKCPRCGLFNPDSAGRCDCGFEFGGDGEAYRHGWTVVVQSGGTLPPRCVKCNAPASGAPIRYTFVDSAVGGAPTGVLSALAHFSTRRKGRVYMSLCKRHRRMRALIYYGGAMLMAVAVVVGLISGFAYSHPPSSLTYAAAILFLFGLFPIGAYQQHYFKGRVTGLLVHVEGAGTKFIESLSSGEGSERAEVREVRT